MKDWKIDKLTSRAILNVLDAPLQHSYSKRFRFEIAFSLNRMHFMVMIKKKLIAKAFLFLNRRRFVKKYLIFGKMGQMLLQMISLLRYVLEKITFFYHWCTLYRTRSVLGRNQNCTSSSFQRLRWNSDTALQQMRQKMKCKMRIWDALLLNVLLINRFLGVFLSSFCFYFLFFFLVAVFGFLTYAL